MRHLCILWIINLLPQLIHWKAAFPEVSFSFITRPAKASTRSFLRLITRILRFKFVLQELPSRDQHVDLLVQRPDPIQGEHAPRRAGAICVGYRSPKPGRAGWYADQAEYPPSIPRFECFLTVMAFLCQDWVCFLIFFPIARVEVGPPGLFGARRVMVLFSAVCRHEYFPTAFTRAYFVVCHLIAFPCRPSVQSSAIPCVLAGHLGA